jgi:dTDP-4-dehydrorhamnose reductase
VPRPLNVYGASKAEAERRILAIMPDALIVRTSAFFGPWDSSNFVVHTLAAIRKGERWRAASDIIVSPTYVPDLVNAALDLLQDREHGIWHLTNEGPVSWFEFAQSAARACGERTDLIEPALASDLGWPATRPAYSALASVRGRVMRTTPEALAAFAATAA